MENEKNDRKKRGIVVKPDGTVEGIEVGHYSDIQLAVGGIMECVATAEPRGKAWSERWTIYGNEMGRICEPPLENNHIARWLVSVVLRVEPEEILTMHGNFVIIGLSDEGENEDVPNIIEEVLKIASDIQTLDDSMSNKEIMERVSALPAYDS